MSLSGPGRQLSLFGVEAADPSPADLAGLLAGPGQVVRMGGTARVSVVVDAAWRVHVLVAEMAVRGLAASWVPTADSHLGVRTAYARSLAPLGAAWLRGAVKRPPANFHLDGPKLRLWVAAAGTAGPWGFLLRLGASDEDCWAAVGAALAGIGLPAVLVTPRVPRPGTNGSRPVGEGAPELSGGDAAERPGVSAPEQPGGDAAEREGDAAEQEGAEQKGEDGGGGPPGRPSGGVEGDGRPPGAARPEMIGGPAYRITGRRRLARLAELVGERPAAAPPGGWPA